MLWLDAKDIHNVAEIIF